MEIENKKIKSKIKKKDIKKGFLIGINVILAIFYLVTNLNQNNIATDTNTYFKMSENLLQSEYSKFPPLYPIILRIFSFGGSIETCSKVMFYVNLILALVFINSIFFYFSKKTDDFRIVAISTLMVLFSYRFFWIYGIMLTELLFVLMSLYALHFIEGIKDDNKNLYIASIFISLCSLTRYVGLLLCVPFFLKIFKEKMIFKKFKDLFISILIIFIPIGIWILRNILVTGDFLGKRTSSATSLIENIALMGYNLISYFIDFKFIINSTGVDPNIELLNENIIIILSIGGIIGILVFTFLFKNNNKILNILKEESSNIIWIVCYVGFIIITSTLIKYDEINTRFTALIFIQLMVVFIKLIDNFKSKLIMMILYCYFVIFIIINCIQLF